MSELPLSGRDRERREEGEWSNPSFISLAGGSIGWQIGVQSADIIADLPLNWRSEIQPDLIASLEQGKEEIVAIEFIPPVDVSVGDYDPKIRTECIADNRRVESEDKIIRIHLSAKANIIGITLLVLFLVGLLVGIVVFGIKLTRR